jgi:DNA mismatch repair protein MSH6
MCDMVIIISGLPTSVLRKAAAKSREFEATYGKYRKVLSETNFLNQSWVDEITAIVQKLNNAATNLSCETVSDGSLMELQCKARKLLQQC